MREFHARVPEGPGSRFRHLGACAAERQRSACRGASSWDGGGWGRPGACDGLAALARLALIVLAAGAAACVAGGAGAPASLDELAQRSLATIDGELAVPGLQANRSR